MNADRFKGKWVQLTGTLTRWRGRVIDDDLKQVEFMGGADRRRLQGPDAWGCHPAEWRRFTKDV